MARAGLGKRVPFGTVALVIAANLPDLDSVMSYWGILAYLKHHRGITHSIVGVAGIGCLYACLLWALKGRGKSRMNTPFLSLVGSVLVVIATHCLMDFTNSYGWRPFLPFWDRWFYGDLVFIVDPYMWLILGGAIFLTAKRIILALFFWIGGGESCLLT